MYKKFLVLQIFYIKLLVPGVIFSLLVSFWSNFTLGNFGLCFLLILPTMHYFIYELRLKNEYYFYANFGFSKVFLWSVTLFISLIIKIITKFL